MQVKENQSEIVQEKIEEKYLYDPLPRQLVFHNSTAKFRLYGGAAGGGKSKALRMEAWRTAISAPNLRIYFFRREYSELEDSVIDPIRSEIPQELYEYNESKKILTCKATGSKILFRHVQHKKDIYKYQGAQMDALFIDELTTFSFEMYDYLRTRLRTVKPYWTTFFAASCNPGGIGHGFVKRIWIDEKRTPKENKFTYEFIPAVVDDNKYIMEFDPGYLDSLDAIADPNKRKALRYGDWNVFDGQYFSEFRHDLHVCKPFEIPLTWRKIIALDYGYSNPSAVLWIALDEDDRAYVYRELYGPGYLYEDLVDTIIEMTPTREMEYIEALVADPALQAKSQDTGRSFFDVAKSRGFHIIGGVNDRIPGWNTVHAFLKEREVPEGHKPKAGLVIFETCKQLIRTLPELIFDDTKVEDVNTDGDDHAPDAVRYGLMYFGKRVSSLLSVSDLNKTSKERSSSSGEDDIDEYSSPSLLITDF